MTIAVRRAGPGDVVKATALRKRLYLESAQAIGNGAMTTAQEWSAFHDILGFLLDPYSIMLLAEDGGETVGILAIQAGGLVGFYKETGITVTWLYIVPEHRGGAALLALVRTAEKAISSEKPVTIHATIRTDNRDMLDSVTRLGYNPVAVIVEKKHVRKLRTTNGAKIGEERGKHAPGGSIGLPAQPELHASP